MASRLAAAAALLCLLSCVKSLTVDKSDGGYKDLLISIHKDVPYNETIVENIKSLLRSSSDFLHRATNGRVYFKHVMINFPNTWPKRSSARSVSSSWFDKSDVRVDLSGSTVEERPFTKQSRLCGERGDYIKLTPTFVAELNASTAKTFRNPAYMFVHEWAHYRYGVFDEHGWRDDEKYPRTYCDDGKVKLNACSTKFRFIPKLASGEICTKLNKTSCRFPKDCIIHVYTSVKDPVESSIMFMPYVANVSQFCDSGKGSRQHNRFAPNKHNAMCKGKSTWEVISENEDFKNLPRPDISKRIEVSFDETQQREDLPQRIVLVLDVSASMDDFQRMTVLKRAATQYTQDIENGSKRLAIITFSSNATVRHPLTTVNDGTRQGFLDSINELEPDTSTCIGCGLLRALEILTTEDETPEGSIIVLISDGIENRDPRLKDVLLQLTAAKVEVSTMALGTEADDQLEMLATVTRGKAFSFQDVQGNRALRMQAAFVEATTTHSGTDNDYVTLTDTARNFTTRLDEKLVLEPSLGNDTIVLVELVKPMQADITVTLIDPSGQKCEQCSEHKDEKTRKIIIPSPAQPGEWTIQVESSDPGPVEVNIQAKSKAKDPNSETIQVACRVASLEVGKPDEAIIYVDVNKGRKAVLDATVFAEVTGPNEPYKSTVKLRDDGRDADVQANDGTYSGYFNEFTGKGRYAVMAHVSGDNETRVSGPKIPSGGGNTMLPLPSATPEQGAEADHEYSIDDFKEDYSTAEVANETSTSIEPAGAFMRVAFGGSFQVTEDIMQSQVPPSAINDLTVVQVRLGANDTLKVQLTWTWPGAHLTYGNASAVEIRASKDDTKLDSEFEKQEEMTMADVVEGNLDPLPAGSKHKVTFAFATKWATLRPDGALDWKIFLAARAANSDGLKSNTSNVVQATNTPPPITTTVAPTTTGATTTKTTTTAATTTASTTTASTTTAATTTAATTTAAITTEATMKATTTHGSTTEAATTTESTTTTTAGGKRMPNSPELAQLLLWVLIGGIAVIVIATMLFAVFRASAKSQKAVSRRRTVQPASAADSELL